MSNISLTILKANGSYEFVDVIGSDTIISDSQWRELQQLSGMTDADRIRLDVEIGIHYNTCLYHQAGGGLPKSSQVRDQLNHLFRRTLQLKLYMDKFFCNVPAYHLYGFNGYNEWKFHEVSPLRDYLMRFAQWAADAGEYLGRTRPGPRSDNLRAFVKYLAQTWTKATGEKASARKARVGPDKTWNFVEFVIAVMEIADPSGPSPEAIGILIKNMSQAREFG